MTENDQRNGGEQDQDLSRPYMLLNMDKWIQLKFKIDI